MRAATGKESARSSYVGARLSDSHLGGSNVKRLFVLVLMLAAMSASAQSACVPLVSPVTVNCTDAACSVDVCWSTTDTSITGCKLYITTPSGALPAIAGTMVTPGALCRIAMPKLITGTHTLAATATNAFGEGAKTAPPLSLVTGGVPAAPSISAVK